jgi:hypothetical protein
MARARRITQRVQDDFDGVWKNMLSEQRFAAFIAFFMPDVYEQIDWTRDAVFLEQELRAITRKSKRGQRSVDRLAKVWLKDGTESWVLVHVEIQSQEDAAFPLRMFQYRYRALDLFGERPITCVAVLGDTNAAWKPHRYSNSFWGTAIGFEFPAVKLLDFADRLDALEQSTNPFARFVLAHLKTLETQGDYETRLQWKLRIIQGLYDMGVPEAEIGQLYHDFDWLLALPAPVAHRYHTTMTQFEEERAMPHLSTAERIGREIGRKEGREVGREEGREEGQRFGALREAQSLLLLLGGKRLGKPSDAVRGTILTIADRDRIERLFERVLDVETWTDLLHTE